MVGLLLASERGVLRASGKGDEGVEKVRGSHRKCRRAPGFVGVRPDTVLLEHRPFCVIFSFLSFPLFGGPGGRR